LPENQRMDSHTLFKNVNEFLPEISRFFRPTPVKSGIRDIQAIHCRKCEFQENRYSDSHTLLKRASESLPWFRNISSDLSKIQWIKSTQNVLSYDEVRENLVNIVVKKKYS
jgi:hypothetical protein